MAGKKKRKTAAQRSTGGGRKQSALSPRNDRERRIKRNAYQAGRASMKTGT